MKIIDLTTQPWQLIVPGEKEEAPFKKVVHLPGTLDEFGVGHADRLDNSCHPDEGTAQNFDADVIATRFTRKHTYEGPAYFEREITISPAAQCRTFFEIERARCVRVSLDGEEISAYEEQTISTPHVFELTGHDGTHQLRVESDNSYPGLPHDAIVYSSAATDETQTNWNGLLGYIRLREENPTFLSQVRVYPKNEDELRIELEIDAKKPDTVTENVYPLSILVESLALEEPYYMELGCFYGKDALSIHPKISENIQKWDEYESYLYDLKVTIRVLTMKEFAAVEDNEEKDAAPINTYRGTILDEKTVRFGIRTFGDDGQGHLALNSRRIFLRSEANCAEFPETGYIPMEVDAWKAILQTYKDYGINMVRFHSHCPPEAAFIAADEMGIFMQPELSHWDPKHALEADESYEYYQKELRQIIKTLANHPSFVMLTFGNELHCGALGTSRMHQMIQAARKQDPTRLYANASNAHYGNEGCDEESDFYASQSFYNDRIRGTLAGNPETPEEAAAVEAYEKAHGKLAKVNIKGYINNQYPNAKTNFDETLRKIREQYKKPVFSFEVGQFEVLPDFDELAHFKGISDPANYRRIQRMVREKGLESVWKQYVEATGELSRLCYREEIEAAMRTKELSGISLLGLQDFPGQGTALVGMLDSHLEPKPFDFAKPEHFHAFFREQLPLVGLEKYTYEEGETLHANVQLANYGKTDCEGEPQWTLWAYTQNGTKIAVKNGQMSAVSCTKGTLSEAGTLEVQLCDLANTSELNLNKLNPNGLNETGNGTNWKERNSTSTIPTPLRCELTVQIAEAVNSYPIWIYKKELPKCPTYVYETTVLDAQAKQVLENGGIVYYSPKSEESSFHNSIRAQFSTDFWSVGTFGRQEGAMGQLIQKDHPLFKEFPTESHTNWQWWPMANQRAVVLPETVGIGKSFDAIITEMDSYAFLRPMAQLFECRVGNGKLLYSTLGLQDLQQYPEGRALLRAIYKYLDSDAFAPMQSMEWETVVSM